MTQLETLPEAGIVEQSLPLARRSLTGIAVVVFALAVVFYAPEDEFTGLVQKIFYVHVASAWIAAVAFFVVFVGSIAYLWKRDLRWDAIAGASAEVGLLFTTVVLVTGMLWGKEVWGVYWSWDPRLTSVLVLWLLYLAYVAIRAYTPEPTRTGALLGRHRHRRLPRRADRLPVDHVVAHHPPPAGHHRRGGGQRPARPRCSSP